MTNAPQQPPAGWYPDPAGSDGERFWDGQGWSQSTRDREVAEPPAQPMAPSYGRPQQPDYGYAYATAQPSPYAQQGPQPAGFGWRLLGFVLDNILINIVVSLLTAAVGLDAILQSSMDRWLRELVIFSENPAGDIPLPDSEFWTFTLYSLLISFVLYGLYRTIMYATLGGTLGQLGLGMRVVRVGADTSTKLSWGSAALRGFLGALLYSTGLLTVITGVFALATARKQTIQDLASRTQVLKIR